MVLNPGLQVPNEDNRGRTRILYFSGGIKGARTLNRGHIEAITPSFSSPLLPRVTGTELDPSPLHSFFTYSGGFSDQQVMINCLVPLCASNSVDIPKGQTPHPFFKHFCSVLSGPEVNELGNM